MIWIVGKNGMLAQDLGHVLQERNMNFLATGREVDATDFAALEAFVENRAIDIIANCAAYTKVDDAEDDAENAFLLNEKIPENLAKIAKEKGAKLIHFSTDYVFSGDASEPYREDDATNPIGVYGKSKLAGEKTAQKILGGGAFIVRTAWLYGAGGKNFVKTMTSLMKTKSEICVVDDQRGSPTWTRDLAEFAAILIEKSREIEGGVWHFTDDGEATWFEFASEIYKIARKLKIVENECRVLPCSTADFPTKARRPKYSVLSKEKAAQICAIPDWKDSLEKFLGRTECK